MSIINIITAMARGSAGGLTPTPPPPDYSGYSAPIITGAASAIDGSYIDVYFDRAITVDTATFNKFSLYKNGTNSSFTASVIKPDNNKAVRLSVGSTLLNTDVIQVSHSGLLTTPSNEYSFATYKVSVANCVGSTKPTSYDKFTFIMNPANANLFQVDGSNNIVILRDSSKAASFAIREAGTTRPTYNAASKKAVFVAASNLPIWDDLLLLGSFTIAFKISKANTTAQNILVQSMGLGNLFTGTEGSFWYARFNGGGVDLNTDFTRTGDELATATIYNCIIRYNGTTMQLYVDGALYFTKNVSVNDGMNFHQIGPIDADYYWLGIANEALTDIEISELNTYLSTL